jgi:membrane associated rhomboid family serine protease
LLTKRSRPGATARAPPVYASPWPALLAVGAAAVLAGAISRVLTGESLGEHFTRLTTHPGVAIAALIGGFFFGWLAGACFCTRDQFCRKLLRNAREALTECPGAEITISCRQVGRHYPLACFR